MTYENEIPEYALQPARAPGRIEPEAVYTSEKIIYPAAEQTVSYQFEEDILVPDTRPDMREILIMDAEADIVPVEKKVSPKTDDLLNITGIITIQTLYNPDGDENQPVAITSKVPYKYQWSLNPSEQADGVFGCKIRNLEYMIINERKFRVKITLEFSGKLFCEREFAFFEGLKDDQLEMKKQPGFMSCLELVKKDEMSVEETFSPKENGCVPEEILRQEFEITENYRQVTTEKMVINGFVFCSILYTAWCDEDTADDEEAQKKATRFCQHNQRIEFTQFIPIDKDNRGKKWSCIKTGFFNNSLRITVEKNEENPDEVFFRLKGDFLTRIEFYENRCRDMTVDAYHRKKNFTCRFLNKKISIVSDGVTSETTVREIINLPENIKAEEAVYCNGKILECQCECEKGKVLVNGIIFCNVLWRDRNGIFRVEHCVPDFHGSIDVEGISPGQKAWCKPVVKTAAADIINDKQIEINCTVMLCTETMNESEIVLLEDPAFTDAPKEKEYPMVIVITRQGDTLWELAKRYHTTEAYIKAANNLESEPEEGRKLLIIK